MMSKTIINPSAELTLSGTVAYEKFHSAELRYTVQSKNKSKATVYLNKASSAVLPSAKFGGNTLHVEFS